MRSLPLNSDIVRASRLERMPSERSFMIMLLRMDMAMTIRTIMRMNGGGRRGGELEIKLRWRLHYFTQKDRQNVCSLTYSIAYRTPQDSISFKIWLIVGALPMNNTTSHIMRSIELLTYIVHTAQTQNIRPLSSHYPTACQLEW